ncbi:MAG TPA: DUF4255 domain-containing protein [Longimicrobium sp.]
MLDLALEFIRDELNGFITARTGVDQETVVLSRFPSDVNNKYGFDEDRLGMTVINLEEERTVRSQLPTHAYVNGQHVVREPDVKINVHALIGANYKQYDEALKFISLVIVFFQSHPVFTPTQYPALDPGIERLAVELQSPTYEQLNQIWGFVGAKQLPSVIYKIRMVVLQDMEPGAMRPPVTGITTAMSGR